ncbi:Amino acid/amide ABC transporter substrate-binding protein (HAAT family) [Hyphomicrobiales bacterium]|nr:Amino acid/amide ABC transporter substrate-binding protein (HAAT family) [Hyphomicrobiales bacterium]CAH1674360.1 Amino acid/amide ABC transporter substrate-binding protein (HAAT family) [Hyphomicrobiales bacterium]
MKGMFKDLPVLRSLKDTFAPLLTRTSPMTRRWVPRLGVVAACAMLSACSGGLGGLVGGGEGGPALGSSNVPGSVIGQGSVKVALLLPLSASGQGGQAAQSLRNAAELAYSEFNNPDMQILVKDTRGTPEGARAAAQAVLSEGAELIIGPLFAAEVQAVAQVAKPAGKPVIAFSTDANVASRGVYLLSFMPQTEINRIVAFAAQQRRRSFAAFVPDTAYGNVAEAAFRTAAASARVQVGLVERFPADAARMREAAQRVAAVASGANPQVDTIFLPDGGASLASAAQALQTAGVNGARVKLAGTGIWNDPQVLALPTMQGGWFAAPDSAGFAAFARRYSARFSAEPVRIASLSYDAVSLSAALVRTQGSQRFSEQVLTNPSGFAGADGVFRFLPDGTNQRALAVLEIRNGAAVTVSPAPRELKPDS